MNNSTAYRTLLERAGAALATDRDPDGPTVRQALLLAVHAGIRRLDGSGASPADWDLFTAAATQALVDVQADLPDPLVLTPGLPSPGPDSTELRGAVVELVRRLADLYATAAGGPTGSPWRRLVWARAAHHLDDAAAELA